MSEVASSVREYRKVSDEIAEYKSYMEGDDADLRELAKAEMPELQRRSGRARRKNSRAAHAARSQRRQKRHPRNPRGHWRRRGLAVRRRAIQHVQPLRGTASMEGRDPEHIGYRPRRCQGSYRQHQREGRVLAAQVSKAEFIACSGFPKPKRREESTPPPSPSPSCPRPTRSKSISMKRKIFASM